MKYSNLTPFILGLTFIGCNAANENLQLQEQVIAVHDSIMPKMGTFVRDNLKIDLLLNKMDSVKRADPSVDTAFEKEKLRSLQSSLKEANETMTDWMHNFDPAQDGKGTEEIESYLQSELQKIRELKNTFSEVEKESGQVLEKYK